MNTGSPKRKRSQRVSSIEVRPGTFARVFGRLREHGVLLRLGLCLLAALAMWLITLPWRPPFPYRMGDIPHRELRSTQAFSIQNVKATEDARSAAEKSLRLVYARDPEPLTKLREELKLKLSQLASTPAGAPAPELWNEFQAQATPAVENTGEAPKEATPATDRETQFQQFRKSLAGDQGLTKLNKAVDDSFKPFETRGLLDAPPANEVGSADELTIYPAGAPDSPHNAKLSEVLIGEGKAFHEQLRNNVEFIHVAERLFDYIKPRLQPTLKFDQKRTSELRAKAVDAVPLEMDHYAVGQPLAKAGQPLGDAEMVLLRKEYDTATASISPTQAFTRSLASLGMILALFIMCGYFAVFRERRLVSSVNRLVVMLVLCVATVGLARWFSVDSWRAELIPLLLFAMTVAIAYRQDVSLLLSVALCLVIVFNLGLSLGYFIVMMGVAANSIFMLGRVRSRSKLITVGLFSGLVAFALSTGIGILEADPLENYQDWERLLKQGGLVAGWTLVAGFLISGSLPFIESQFGVVTDISLLELGDVSHPLLQELVRRAPGTYNHSITVASIGDAAAESIGANGLLVRVGAYFHDIGKMLKPQYFIENQGQDGNRHESLAPAMSALIIIAHVKDGADLARQHGLPESIIDFIEQHHGTTLVEYFYKRARGQQEENPDASAVMESDFRYPGPKPQTKEAAVMMISDAVESASRVLAEPTPTRIRNLIHELAMKRLLDGQFDECGLNLRELKTVEDSLVKSLTAVYHSRVKYPDQKSA